MPDPVDGSSRDASGIGVATATREAPSGQSASASSPSSIATIDGTPSGSTSATGLGMLGGVRLLSLLGSGGMGKVYLGHHLTMHVDVAVKVVGDGSADLTRFQREAALCARITHEHVVRIHHAGVEDGRAYLVQEFIAGRNLKQVLRDAGPLPWREATRLALHAARGLGAAHAAGVVHRDVKPSNIMVGADGVAKIADLGLARHLEQESDDTQTGAVLGTPSYIAPEQARDARTADARSDVYALGVTMFQMLTGRTPFEKVGHTSMLLAHLHDPVPDIRRLASELPEALARLVERMLAKDPAKRPADGDAVARELEQLRAPGASSHVSRPRARWVQAAAVLVAAVTVIGVTMATGTAARATGYPSPRATARHRAAPAMAGAPADAAVATVAASATSEASTAETWQTPARAVFLLADGVAPEVLVAITSAMHASGLPVVERAKIDALTAEQDLSGRLRVDPAAMGRLGKLLGGQVAVFASALPAAEAGAEAPADPASNAPAHTEADGVRVELRTVVVETGELADYRIVPLGDIARTLPEMVGAAAALLPARGNVELRGTELVATLGSVHGLRAGDRLRIWSGTASTRGEPLAKATVASVARDSAVIHLDGPAVEAQGKPVSRIER